MSNFVSQKEKEILNKINKDTELINENEPGLGIDIYYWKLELKLQVNEDEWGRLVFYKETMPNKQICYRLENIELNKTDVFQRLPFTTLAIQIETSYSFKSILAFVREFSKRVKSYRTLPEFKKKGEII